MTRKSFFLLCLVLQVFILTNAHRDRTHRFFEQRLARFRNKLSLLSNNSFAKEIFQRFLTDHHRRFEKSSESNERFKCFQKNLRQVIVSNVAQNQTFTVGINKYSDWNATELQILRGTVISSAKARPKILATNLVGAIKTAAASLTKAVLSDEFDYANRVSVVNTTVSILRPVKDQGQCGSCYAFATITLVEAQYSFQYGVGVNMSEQQIVDCSKGDYGCSGGYFDTTFNYLNSSNWYMNDRSQYPYQGVASTCKTKTSGGWSVGKLTYRTVQPGNATAMQQALVDFGPLWISLYVGSDCSNQPSSCPVTPSAAAKIMSSFQGYNGGIFQVDGCVTSVYNNNHAMVIVGYGRDPVTNLDYWKVRNSWGEDWGENGYVRIRRGVNMCNIESDAYFIAKPAP